MHPARAVHRDPRARRADDHQGVQLTSSAVQRTESERRGRGSAAPLRPSDGAATAGRVWLLPLLAFAPIALLTGEHLTESDPFWAARTGLWILEHGRLPVADPFSWTMAGQPWTLNSWAFDMLLGLAFAAGGVPLIAVLSFALVLAMAATVLLAARLAGATPAIAGWLLALASPLLLVWLTGRPQLVDYVALPGLLLLVRALIASRRPLPRLAAIAGLQVLWVNLHAAVLIGLAVLAAAVVLAALRSATRASVPRLLLAVAVSGVAVLANPYGAGVYAQAAAVRASSASIYEWRPFDPTDPVAVLTLALGAAALVVALRGRDVVATAAGVVTVGAALAANRALPLVVVTAVPVLAAALSRTRLRSVLERHRRAAVTVAVAGVVIPATIAAMNLGTFGRPGAEVYPVALVRSMPAGPTFNSYLLGGYLILERPDVPVSVDSRSDLYGPAVLAQQDRTLAGRGDLGAALRPVRSVLIPPTSGLAQRLRQDPSWRVAGTEPAAVLFVRR